jgi:hypothetical protein
MGMAPLSSLLVGQEAGGRVFLRFSATLVNVGEGPLIVAAHRSFPSATIDHRPADRNATGGYSERVRWTPA